MPLRLAALLCGWALPTLVVARRSPSSVGLQLFPCDGANPRQQWVLERAADGADLRTAGGDPDPESGGACAVSGGGGGTQNGGSPILLGPCGSHPWAVIGASGALGIVPAGVAGAAKIAVAPFGAAPGAPIYEMPLDPGSAPGAWSFSNATGLLQLRAKPALCLDAGSSFNASCAAGPLASQPACDASLPAVSRAADIVQRMDLSEKVLALTVMDRRSNGVPRLGVPPLPYGEALHGVCAKICGQPAPLGDG